jgi:hypothetical protein
VKVGFDSIHERGSTHGWHCQAFYSHIRIAIARAETGREITTPWTDVIGEMEGGFSCSMHLPRTKAADLTID